MNDNNQNDITFTIAEEDLPTTKKFLTEIQTQLMYQDLIINSEVAKVSIIAVGMISHSGVAYKMFHALTYNT